MKPSVINCGAVLGSPREGNTMAGGDWDHFSADGGSRFSISLGARGTIQWRAKSR